MDVKFLNIKRPDLPIQVIEQAKVDYEEYTRELFAWYKPGHRDPKPDPRKCINSLRKLLNYVG